MGHASTLVFLSSIKPAFDGNLLGVVSAKAAHSVWMKTSAWLEGSWARSNFLSLICCLHHSIFPNALNLDSLCYPIQQLFQPFCQKAPIKPVLLCFFGCTAWDAEKKCACDKLKVFLFNVEIVMGRKREAMNICFIIWKVSCFAALFNRRRKLSPLCLYLFQAFTKYPFNLSLKVHCRDVWRLGDSW